MAVHNPSYLYYRAISVKTPRDLPPAQFAAMKPHVESILKRHLDAAQADLDEATKGGLKIRVGD